MLLLLHLGFISIPEVEEQEIESSLITKKNSRCLYAYRNSLENLNIFKESISNKLEKF